MLHTNKFLGAFAGLGLAISAPAAEGPGVAPAAAKLIDFGNGWAITNSMVTGWTISLLLVLGVIALVRRPKIFPTRGQAVFESLLEALRDLFEPIVGKKAFPAAFPLLVTLFIFILFHNWMGLIPGVGTIGWGHDVEGKFELTKPLIRPHNTDFNSTIALSLISFVGWLLIVLKYAGPVAIIKDFFGNKADKSETPAWLYPILSVIFIGVGFIEVLSIAIRPITLSVRLFGNVYGGENLLHGMNFLFVFYFMECLVGLVQALVFTLLTAVYIGLLCNHGDDHDHEGDPAHEPSH
jgi:F-type H+-transporting ATPase subunit a